MALAAEACVGKFRVDQRQRRMRPPPYAAIRLRIERPQDAEQLADAGEGHVALAIVEVNGAMCRKVLQHLAQERGAGIVASQMRDAVCSPICG